MNEQLHRHADEVAADQIGCERAVRKRRKYRVEQQPQPPAQPSTQRRTDADRQKTRTAHEHTPHPGPLTLTAAGKKGKLDTAVYRIFSVLNLTKPGIQGVMDCGT